MATDTLVDRYGTVVGTAERSVVRRDNLRHAATAVLVRDSGAPIYVHRRSPDKDWAPEAHDTAAGGMLTAGEEPAGSTARELAEELGITGIVLRTLGLSVYEDLTRLTNAKTEAGNVTIKNIKRTGRGYRSPAAYRSRIMLYNAARSAA